MIYLDTSAAVPLFVTEPASTLVDAWFSACVEPLVSSDWILAEFGSALSIKRRSGTLSAKNATAAWRSFEKFCQEGLRLAPVSRHAFGEASRIARKPEYGMRAGDALHLAMTLEIGAETIATLDISMAGAAKKMKLKTIAFS